MAYPEVLSTVVRNISGATRYFSYLGAHGVTLADNATYSEESDLRAKFSASTPSNRMKRSALNNDLANGHLQIDQTARTIDIGPYDTPKMVVVGGIEDESVTTADPDYSV